MSFDESVIKLKMDLVTPIFLSLFVVTMGYLMRNENDLGLDIVLWIASVGVVYSLLYEARRVANLKKRLKRFRDLVNCSAKVRFAEVEKHAKADVVYGIGMMLLVPCVVRISHLSDSQSISLELASLFPEIEENDIVQVGEKSLAGIGDGLELRIIDSPKIQNALEVEFFTPFVLPVHAQKEVEFEAAVSAGRGKRAWGKRLFNSWRIRLVPAAIGTFFVVLTWEDVFHSNTDPWAYPFWAAGVAMVVFAARFGISFDGVHLKYCNGLRTYKWKPQEIASVHREFGTVFGFLSESAGTYPMLLLTNGLTADLSLFSYSSKDSAQAYLLIESICRKQEAKLSAYSVFPASESL